MNTRARDTIARPAPWRSPLFWLALGALTLGAGLAVLRPVAAQETQDVAIVSADELDEIVGPIALYPDDLVAIVLPASTYPLQVVQAARFLEDRKRDSSLQPDEEWDDSIVALLNYPEVVELMNDDLDWTYDLGTAVLNQRADVLNAIQGFRDRAYAAGNLRSDERQTVARDDGEIVIKPANPQVIYVPYYEPERVVIYQPVPVYHYYPRRYPVYYYPYPASYVFDTGYFWGVRSWFSIGWHSHLFHVYDPFYHSHPYYGWSYYDPWYPRNVYININRYPNYVWEPRQRYGGRPVVRGYEGRVYTADRAPSPDRAPRRGVLDSSATRSREGSTYRTAERAAPSSGATTGANTAQPRRGVPSSSYRSRSIETTDRASQAAQASRPTRAAPTGQQRAPSVERQPSTRTAPTGNGGYRSGGGMAQARERAQAEPSRAVPRAAQPSSGMPRESPRSFEAQSSPPRAPSGGGMGQAQRGDGGGSYRGGGNSGGGASQRNSGESGGGGREHPAARGGEGRSAGR